MIKLTNVFLDNLFAVDKGAFLKIAVIIDVVVQALPNQVLDRAISTRA